MHKNYLVQGKGIFLFSTFILECPKVHVNDKDGKAFLLGLVIGNECLVISFSMFCL